jgi:hypothetical protein
MVTPVSTFIRASGDRILNRPFIRSVEGNSLLEIFFVTAVAAVLGIRFFLEVTGYPQLSGRGLHIAHVLLGGAFMLLAIMMLLAYTNKSASYTASVLGGFGFGAFVDEIGKFLTGDNNYFFQPAVALIYVTFVLIYLIIEALYSRPVATEQEKLVNVLEIAKEAVLKDMDPHERKRALDLVEECDPSDPVARALREVLLAIESSPLPEPNLYLRAKSYAQCFYSRMVAKKWFADALITMLVVQSLGSILLNSAAFAVEVLVSSPQPALSFTEIGGMASDAIAAAFVASGVIKIRSSRLDAYNAFKRAVLVQIFLSQVFVFYKEQFWALVGLSLNILMLLALKYMISQEITPAECVQGLQGEKVNKISTG